MSKSQVELVEAQGFTINLPSVGSPVAVRAEGDEIVVTVGLALRPRDNVMNIHLDVSAGGDSAPVSGLDQDSSSDVGGDIRSCLHELESPELLSLGELESAVARGLAILSRHFRWCMPFSVRSSNPACSFFILGGGVATSVPASDE